MIYKNSTTISDWVDFNITPEQIQEMTNILSTIDESYLYESKSSNDILDDIGNHLNKFFEDGIDISKVIAKTSDQIIRTIKLKGLNKSSIEEVDAIMSKAFIDMTDSFAVRDAAYLKFKYYDANNIRKSMKLLLYVYILNSVFNMVLSTLLGPIGNIITCVIIAPIVEESAKRISITGKFGKEFAITFNAFEFTSYVINFSGVDKIIAIRAVVVGMHLITFIINWIANNTGLLELLHLDKEKDEKQISNIGYLVGIFIHSIWNGGLSNIVVSSILS